MHDEAMMKWRAGESISDFGLPIADSDHTRSASSGGAKSLQERSPRKPPSSVGAEYL
jgi:hypothetical protein